MSTYSLPDRRRIFLLRHGEAAYIQKDGSVTTDPRMVNLTETGRIQARKQAAVLASVDFDRAICSGLPRTVETARHILSSREHPQLEVVSQLEEIASGGAAARTGDAEEWLARIANPWAGADAPDAKFLGGEKFSDFAQRVIPAFEAIVADTTWAYRAARVARRGKSTDLQPHHRPFLAGQRLYRAGQLLYQHHRCRQYSQWTTQTLPDPRRQSDRLRSEQVDRAPDNDGTDRHQNCGRTR